jgi:hypothetical protein
MIHLTLALESPTAAFSSAIRGIVLTMGGRVFILGAGVSREDTVHLQYPLPLAREFFTSHYISEYWPTSSGFAPFHESATGQILTHYFGAVYRKKGRRYSINCSANIEEVYSFIESFSNEYNGIATIPGLLETAKAELVAYIETLISSLPWKLNEPKVHSAIVRALTPEDSLLTFNWDLLIDKALNLNPTGQALAKRQLELFESPSRNVPFFLGIPGDNGYYLRLHGAVNLAICSNPSCRYRSVPHSFGLDDHVADMWLCRGCGAQLETMIIPPHVHKSYAAHAHFRLQANIAAELLRAASEIFLLGYAIPVFDFNAATLFRIGRMDPRAAHESGSNLHRVVVANPEVLDKSYQSKIRTLFGLNRTGAIHGRDVELVLYSNLKEFLSEELTPAR